MKDKWTTIQGLRALGVLAVLCSHVMYVEHNVSPTQFVLPNFDRLGLTAIDLFFVISGVVMVIAASRAQGRRGGSLGFLWQRAARIYPLYWILTAVVIGLAWLQPDWSLGVVWRNYRGDFLRCLLLLPQSQGKLLFVSWTLVYEMYFYLVVAFLGVLTPKRMVQALAAWGLFVVVGYYSLVKGPALWTNTFTLVVTDPLTLEFILGCLAGLMLVHGDRRHARHARRIGGAVFVVATGLYLAGWIHVRDWPRVAFQGMPCALLVYGLAASEQGTSRTPRWLRAIGDASYSIYLSHVIVIALIRDVWGWFTRPGYFDNVLAITAMVFASLLFGLLCYRFVEAPLMKLTRWPPPATTPAAPRFASSASATAAR